MAKAIDNTARVSAYIQMQEPLQAALQQGVREAILATDTEVAEQIKWNVPAFYYSGAMQPFDPKEYKRDIVVFNTRGKEHLLLVFPTGARVADECGILHGDYKDGRRLVTIKDMVDLEAMRPALQQVIKQWLATVDK